MPDSTPPDDPLTGSDPLTRGDLVQIRRAITQQWDLPASVRAACLQRVIDLVDRYHEDGAKTNARKIAAAMRIILAADHLNLEWARFEAQLRREAEQAQTANGTDDYVIDLCPEHEQPDPTSDGQPGVGPTARILGEPG